MSGRDLHRRLGLLGWPLAGLVAGVAVAYGFGGVEQAVVVATVALLEISLSFDNAVINATVLRRMSVLWQRLFMTIGLGVAVIGMRFLFPVVVVMLTAGLGFGQVIGLALHQPAEYARILTAAHAAIAAFGGLFLLMIFLDFLLRDGKSVHWLAVIERPLARAGSQRLLPSLLGLTALLAAALAWAGEARATVLTAGMVGLAVYLGVQALTRWFERLGGASARRDEPATGRSAFFLFLYLNILDAAFSFDGVIGAFAISTNVLAITLGLGIGALFVRGLTLWLVRHKTLEAFIYLEHGAHYAVGALAVLLGLSLAYDIPDVVTGLAGAVILAVALASSWQARQPVALPDELDELGHNVG